jgi:hypothetical protein
MYGVTGCVSQSVVDSPPEHLGPQPAVNRPLFIPGRFQGKTRGPPKPVLQVGTAKSPEGCLDSGILIGAGVIQLVEIVEENRFRIGIENDQRRLEKRLDQKVIVNKLSEVPAISNVPERGIELLRSRRLTAGMDRKPFGISGEIVEICVPSNFVKENPGNVSVKQFTWSCRKQIVTCSPIIWLVSVPLRQ